MLKEMWLWKREASFQRTRWELLSELPVDGDSEFHSSLFRGLFPVRFGWEIRREPGSYRLVETAHISHTWYLFLAASILVMTTGYIGSSRLQGWTAAASFLMMIISLPVLPLLFGAQVRCKSPVEDLFRQSGNHIELIPIVSLIIAILPAFLLVLFGRPLLQLIGLAGLYVILIGYYLYEPLIAESSLQWQVWLDRTAKRLPAIASNYIVGTAFGSFLLLLFIGIHDKRVFLALVDAFPVVVPLVLSVLLLGLLAMLIYSLNDSWSFEVSRFDREGRTIQKPASVVLTALAVTAFSVIFAFLSYRFLVSIMRLLEQYRTVGTYAFVFVSGLPVLFVVTGLIYQVVSVFWALFTISSKASSLDEDGLPDMPESVYILDHSGVFAGALSLFDDYIIVSRGVVDELSDRELAVVLAHEQAHINHKESRMTLLISFLSPLIFTGKNVFYAVMDFRAREYRADQYAAERVESQDQVVETLDHLQELSNSSSAEEYSTVTPTMVSFSSQDNDPSLFDRLFGFYFGDFAFSQAHPSLEERKRQFE